MIRPQYSQTMIFLRERISSCLWGGILLKQPPQASRCTYTIPNPLREFLRIRLKDWSKRGSILVSSSLALSLSFSSSCLVSEMISSSSFFLTSRSFCLSSNASVLFAASADFSCSCAANSLILLSQSSISRVWNSISLLRKSYSRLLRTFSCCSLYFAIEAFEVSISTFLVAMADFSSATSALILSIRVLRPAISSSKSCTSSGSSPLKVLISSILDNIVCNWNRAFNFCSTVNS